MDMGYSGHFSASLFSDELFFPQKRWHSLNNGTWSESEGVSGANIADTISGSSPTHTSRVVQSWRRQCSVT